MTSIRTIKAAVHKDAILRTSRFYKNGMIAIIGELLQNSRRAGATKVEISFDDDEMTITDNGHGVKDPQTLLSFGESKWTGNISEAEDSAGMGVFSLSQTGAKITSRHKDSDTGWSGNFSKAAFEGQEPVEIITANVAQGTRITFPAEPSHLETELMGLIKYYPLPVILKHEGKVVEFDQVEFLAEAHMTKDIGHSTIGLFVEAKPYPFRSSSINFYGHTTNDSLPTFRNASKSEEIYFRVDVKATSGLKFVLPSRSSLIHDSSFKALEDEAYDLFYKYLETLNTHQYSFDKVAAARKKGYDVIDAKAALQLFDPSTADAHFTHYGKSSMIDLAENPILIDTRSVPSEQHIKQGLENTKFQNRAYHVEPQYEGYGWYDTLTRLNHITYCVEVKNKQGDIANHSIGDVENEKMIRNFDEAVRAEGKDITAMWIELCQNEDQALADLRMPIDILALQEEDAQPDDIVILTTKDNPKKLTDWHVIDFLTDTFFCPSDGHDCDSYDTQRKYFQDDIKMSCRHALMTDEAAKRATIIDAVRETLMYLLDGDEKLSISVGKSVLEDPEKPWTGTRQIDVVFEGSKAA